MADSTDGLFLWGDDFEAILDVLEDTEELEEQFAVTVRNVFDCTTTALAQRIP